MSHHPRSPASPQGQDGRATWLVQWALVTFAAAVVATVIDALLLQRSRDYFTGGFLSADHITGVAEAFAFFAGSLLADAAVIGTVVAIALWVGGRIGAARWRAGAVAGIVALVPLAVANFIEYRLATYLGDAFDLALMFELTGRSPEEVLAVSSAHLASLAGITGGVLVAGGGMLWFVLRALRRRAGGPAMPTGRVALRTALIVPMALLLAGTAGSALLRSSSDVLDNGLRRKPAGRMLGIVVNTLSDVDRDGYGIIGRPPDPSLFDGRVHPYALDVPGNGIDENGVAGDLPADVEPYTEPVTSSTSWQSKPDVVLIVLESFRADVLGATVAGRPVTPVIDALAHQGAAVGQAYSHNGYTVQSRRHIFTGSVADVRGPSTLIDDFNAQGYETAYFSGQDESFGGPRQGVGFERADTAYDARADRERRYSTFTTAGSLAVPHTVVTERVASFLAARQPGRPLFLYVNFHDTHFPYHHRFVQPLVEAPVLLRSEIAPGREHDLRAMYLNTAANVDRAIGEVLDTVRASLGAEPGVIVLSDHGESLFDEGFLGHGYALNDAQTRIPLVVSGLPLVLPEPFGQTDLRDSIHAALTPAPRHGAAPIVLRDETREVFQYLGTFRRPAQIAFTTTRGRTIYDFRSDRLFIDGSWRRPGDLDAAGQVRFRTLVHTWERMMLARSAAGVGADTQ